MQLNRTAVLFVIEDQGNRHQLRNAVYFKRFFSHFYHPCGRYGRFYDLTGRSNLAVSVTVDHSGPIRDTVKSTVAATGTEKRRKNDWLYKNKCKHSINDTAVVV